MLLTLPEIKSQCRLEEDFTGEQRAADFAC